MLTNMHQESQFSYFFALDTSSSGLLEMFTWKVHLISSCSGLSKLSEHGTSWPELEILQQSLSISLISPLRNMRLQI